MRTHGHRVALVVGLVAAVFAPGCFAVADLDRFEETCTGNSGETRDFNFEVTSLTPHAGQLFELRVFRTDVAAPVPVAAVVYDGVPEMNSVVVGTLRDALAPGQYEARFWAAFGGNRTFVFPGADHSWNEEVPDNGCFAFTHMGPFDADITPANDPARGDVTLTLSNVGDAAGSPLLWRVREQDGPDVGLYRLDALPALLADARVMTLPDIAVDDNTYAIDAFIDLDENGTRSADEPLFTPPAQGALSGVAFTLDLSAP